MVDAGGLLKRRRYLLPLSLLRFDERTRVLRVSIDKDVANRYPDFDRDEFQTMSDDGSRRLRGAAAAVLPADDGRRANARRRRRLPDWLLTGTWITVPPQRAEQLPAEARSFVNEFVPIHGEDVPPPREQMVAREDDTDAPPTPRGVRDAAARRQAARSEALRPTDVSGRRKWPKQTHPIYALRRGRVSALICIALTIADHSIADHDSSPRACSASSASRSRRSSSGSPPSRR